MRKVWIAALVVLFFNPVTANASSVKTCYFNDLNPNVVWSDWEVQKTITCFANKFGVSAYKARAIAWRESRYNESAYNYSSGAAGLFQHLIRYWPKRADKFPDWQRWMRIKGDCWCNPRLQSLVTVKMVAEGGWGPWE